MKRFTLFISLVLVTEFIFAQEAVNVTFSASTESGFYCPFSSVKVTNMTRDWSFDMAYPDTVLVLGNVLGIGEIRQGNESFHLGDVYPNPFGEEASASLDIYEEGEVLLRVYDVDGRIMVKKQQPFKVGNFRVRLRLSSPQLAYLSAVQNNNCQVKKMVKSGVGSCNEMDVEFVSVLSKEKRDADVDKQYVFSEFVPGDLMQYEAFFKEGNVMESSKPISQYQYEDDTITLRFEMDLPTVLTNEVTNITWNSAVCVGEVAEDGNTVVTERGFCWSTGHNPTTDNNHSVSDSNGEIFRVNMTGLEASTTYYARAYAINHIGTSYGEEIEFVTSDLPFYTVNVTTNLNNSGVVTGGGSYQLGQTCTLHAVADTGYFFVGWSENGSTVSNNAYYTFTVSENHHVIAQFFPSFSFYEGQSDDYSTFAMLSNTNSVYCAFDSLMANHPEYITKQRIGSACDGQDLYCYEFGREEGVEKPKFIVICSQHGFEKNSTYGMYYFLKDVAENADSVPFLNYVHEILHFVVVPVVNPSGFSAFSYKNANGVNLNRNWPVVNWMYFNNPSSTSYAGLAPLDQPETRVVDSLVNLNLDARLFIDFHTNGYGVVDTARKINWLSYPKIEDTLARRKMLDLSHEHLDSITSNFKRIYGIGRPVLMDCPRFGYITWAQQYSTVGYAEVSMAQRGILSLTFEGFNGFPGDNKPFLPDVSKANSELIGDFIYRFCNSFLR